MMRALVFLFLSLGLAPAFFPAPATARQEATVYVCPMHAEVQSSTPGNCPKCEMKLVSKKDATPAAPAGNAEDAEAYTCPMHLEIRAGAPGKCPKCNMSLVVVNPGIPDEFDLRLESTPKAPRSNEKVRLRFSVFNPKTGKQAKQFAIMHDQLFHLFVVSQDMDVFQHIHPEFAPDGSFTIETVLPRPGRYKVYSDFYPVEGTPQVLHHSIVTAGYKSDLMSSGARLKPDTVLAKVVDGMKIELKIDPPEIIAGKPAQLKYHLTSEKTGEPVKDLKPYLAAWGHTLILSEDQSDFVHSHPEESVPENGLSEKQGGGPVVTFDALFPRPGNYRIWTQFLRGGTLTTVSFTVRAEQLR